MLLEENKQKYLVVNDELNDSDREDIIKDIGVDEQLSLFSPDFDYAIELYEKNYQSIAVCFLDLRLPQSAKDGFKIDELGLHLASQIDPDTHFALHSAYFSDKHIQNLVKKNQFKNLIGVYGKPSTINYKQVYDRTLEIINLQKAESIVKENRFNYEDLDAETKLLVIERTNRINFLVKRSSKDLFNVGKYLTEVKESLDHGYFYPWLRAEFPLGESTAARLMQTYRKFKSCNLQDLNLSHSVLYELAANSVPNEVVQETFTLAKSGENITVDFVKSLKAEYRRINDSQDSSTEVESNTLELFSNSNSTKSSPDQDNFAPSTKDNIFNSIKQKVVKVISPQRFWEVGKKKHLVVCQDPNSQNFLDLLPQKINLCLAFPSIKNWQFQIEQYESILNFYTIYQDLNLSTLVKLARETIEITTDGEDNVVVCYIPDPEILSLINSLGCRAFIADPDRDKCLALIEASQSVP